MNRAILVVAAVGVVLAACSGSEVCGPSTCDGCCTSDGVCVAGDQQAECGDNGLWCQACSGAQTCQAGLCRAPAVTDAGTPDAGHEEADAGVVFVTMRYDYQQQTGTTCPFVYATQSCSSVKTMDPGSFAALRLEYPECNVSETDADGYLIDCSSLCAPETRQCNNASTGGASNYTFYVCQTPAHTSAAACQWDVP